MIYWAFVFFIISVFTGLLGFAGLSQTTGGVSQTLFYVFFALFVVSLAGHLATGRKKGPAIYD